MLCPCQAIGSQHLLSSRKTVPDTFSAPVELPPLPQARRLPWRLYCLTAGSLLIPSIGWSSGKKNPAKPNRVAAAGGLLAVLPPFNNHAVSSGLLTPKPSLAIMWVWI